MNDYNAKTLSCNDDFLFLSIFVSMSFHLLAEVNICRSRERLFECNVFAVYCTMRERSSLLGLYRAAAFPAYSAHSNRELVFINEQSEWGGGPPPPAPCGGGGLNK